MTSDTATRGTNSSVKPTMDIPIPQSHVNGNNRQDDTMEEVALIREEETLMEGDDEDEEIASVDGDGKPIVDTTSIDTRNLTMALVHSVVEAGGSVEGGAAAAAVLPPPPPPPPVRAGAEAPAPSIPVDNCVPAVVQPHRGIRRKLGQILPPAATASGEALAASGMIQKGGNPENDDSGRSVIPSVVQSTDMPHSLSIQQQQQQQQHSTTTTTIESPIIPTVASRQPAQVPPQPQPSGKETSMIQAPIVSVKPLIRSAPIATETQTMPPPPPQQILPANQRRPLQQVRIQACSSTAASNTVSSVGSTTTGEVPNPLRNLSTPPSVKKEPVPPAQLLPLAARPIKAGSTVPYPVRAVPCPLASKTDAPAPPQYSSSSVVSVGKDDATDHSGNPRGRVFSIDIEPGLDFSDVNIENLKDSQLEDVTSDPLPPISSSPSTVRETAQAVAALTVSSTQPTAVITNDITPIPPPAAAGDGALMGRDRAMSFEFYSFGFNADEPLPPVPEMPGSLLMRSPPTAASTTTEDGSSNKTRPRGDSIIFDPTSFQDGGILEEKSLMRLRENSVDISSLPADIISSNYMVPSSSSTSTAVENPQAKAHSGVGAAAAIPVTTTSGGLPPPPSHQPPQTSYAHVLPATVPSSPCTTHLKPSPPPPNLPQHQQQQQLPPQHTTQHPPVHPPHPHSTIPPSSTPVLTPAPNANSSTAATHATPSTSGTTAATTGAAAEMATLPSLLNTNSSNQHATFQMDLLNKDGRIGIYLPEARKARIAKFHSKRKMRIWRKRIKYDCRKKLADSRPRIKGRFVKRSDMGDGDDPHHHSSSHHLQHPPPHQAALDEDVLL